jgi:predicted O-methyltransferase YrrM
VTTHLSVAALDSVTGYFQPVDVALFRILLDATAAAGPGDLAELGVYYGKSAVLVGSSLRVGETFTVVDLFGTHPGDSRNAAENDDSYPGLTRRAFEDNYRRLLGGTLPTVVQGLSHTIVDHARHGTHRFVHVDASHLHANVVRDIDAARLLLRGDGVVVLDDIRSEHTPGVAAAAWQAVLTSELRPFAISPFKLYATFADDGQWASVVAEGATQAGYEVETQVVNDRELVRVHGRPPALGTPAHPARRFVPPVLWPLVGRAARRLGVASGTPSHEHTSGSLLNSMGAASLPRTE